MTITLPPTLDALVVKKLNSGLYENAADVVRDALRQMDARESAIDWLKSEAAIGFDQLDRGEFAEMDQDAFMNHFRARRQAA